MPKAHYIIFCLHLKMGFGFSEKITSWLLLCESTFITKGIFLLVKCNVERMILTIYKLFGGLVRLISNVVVFQVLRSQCTWPLNVQTWWFRMKLSWVGLNKGTFNLRLPKCIVQYGWGVIPPKILSICSLPKQTLHVWNSLNHYKR